MGVQAAISEFTATDRVLAHRVLDDGTKVVLVGVVAGPTYRIERERDGLLTIVFETTFPDEAESVFECCEAADRPWHPAYLPIGKAFPAAEGRTVPVHAVGATVELCVEAFLTGLGDTLEPGSLRIDEADSAPGFQWGARFASARGGSGFKAAGRDVPGGRVMTWWS